MTQEIVHPVFADLLTGEGIGIPQLLHYQTLIKVTSSTTMAYQHQNRVIQESFAIEIKVKQMTQEIVHPVFADLLTGEGIGIPQLLHYQTLIKVTDETGRVTRSPHGVWLNLRSTISTFQTEHQSVVSLSLYETLAHVSHSLFSKAISHLHRSASFYDDFWSVYDAPSTPESPCNNKILEELNPTSDQNTLHDREAKPTKLDRFGKNPI
ncbi:hypothetical protein DY000_02032574 [Brassica cretica]|uniref:Uncharacterized protein n=1 Tax=Brassica cretica TaxID=69181 RepID=A0ABQ7DUU1_BRACR|nr:hypothetical protein DY000_02032574 [Brassica cretica]